MKSHFILAFLFLVFFSFSCGSDDEGMNPSIEGSHIEVTDLIGFLPADIKNEKNALFMNPQGASLSLVVDYKETVENLSLENQSYTSDKFTVSMSEGPAGDYLINLVGTATFDSKSFKVLLVPGNGSDPIRGEIPYDHIDGTTVGNPANGEFLATLDLGVNSFVEVFKFERNITNSFSELYINEEVGLVAFRDGDNTLWVFDKFQ